MKNLTSKVTWHRGIGGRRFTFVIAEGVEWKLAEISGGACVAMRCIDRMPYSAGTVFDSTDEALAFLRVA